MNHMTENRFNVTGMKCDGCITNANKALSKLTGFESAEFDLQAGTAVVRGNVDQQVVCQALNQAGFPTVVKR